MNNSFVTVDGVTKTIGDTYFSVRHGQSLGGVPKCYMQDEREYTVTQQIIDEAVGQTSEIKHFHDLDNARQYVIDHAAEHVDSACMPLENS